MAAAGILTGSSGPDDEFLTDQGLGKYKINLNALWRWLASGGIFGGDNQTNQPGDILVSYDWLQPMAIVLAMGADTQERHAAKDPGANKWLALLWVLPETWQTATNVLAEQKFLTGIRQLFGGRTDAEGKTNMLVKGLEMVVASTLSTFVPSSLNRAGNIFDSTRRDTEGDTTIEKGLNRGMARTPGLAQLLPANLNVFGQKRGYYKPGTNAFLRTVGQLLNPAISKVYNPTEEEALVINLYNATKEGDIIPKKRYESTRSFSVDGKKISISPEVYQRVFKETGPLFEADLRDLVKSGIRDLPTYSETDPDQLDAVRDVISWQNDRLRERLLEFPEIQAQLPIEE